MFHVAVTLVWLGKRNQLPGFVVSILSQGRGGGAGGDKAKHVAEFTTQYMMLLKLGVLSIFFLHHPFKLISR